MFQNVLCTLLMIASSVVSGIDSTNTLFHLPWACVVVYPSSPRWRVVSSCAILNDAHVLVSVDNFFAQPDSRSQAYFRDEMLNKMWVMAGSNYINNTTPSGRKVPSGHQARIVDIFIGKTLERARIWVDYIHRPLTTEAINQISREQSSRYGVLYNVGIVSLSPAFVWSAYIRPITMNFLQNEQTDYNAFQRRLENTVPPSDRCITYSWNESQNRMRYHEVLFLPKRNCFSLFCHWYIDRCEEYPRHAYQYCFKSTKFVDVCPNARGSALYCPAFASHSVFGILTSAPSCGLRKMPGVYSTLPLAIRLWELVYKENFASKPRPPIGDVFKLEQVQDY